MRKIMFLLPAAVMMFGAAGEVSAQTAESTVTYEVQAINSIAITGSPSLVVSTATAGSAPNAASDATSQWAITTNETDKKVTAAIDTDMATGLTLTVNLTAPSVGTSNGVVTLSSAAADVVTGLTKVEGSELAVTYSLTATTAAGVVSSATKTVTYTVVAGA